MWEHKEEQFFTLYDEFADAIFRHCYFRVYERERAKELTQEVFERTWKYLTDGRDIQNPKAFLYRVANNMLIDESRKRKEISLDAMQEAGFEPSASVRVTYEQEHIEQRVEAHLLLDVVNKLDTPFRQVIVMRYIDDLRPKEIAHILGESENVVSVRLHRALNKVRKLM